MTILLFTQPIYNKEEHAHTLSVTHYLTFYLIFLQLRVSAVTSNSPYILVLDCDMFCNDPSSARQAMCFHLDHKISPSLAFVQFPQKFHDISKNDIYDCQRRSIFTVRTETELLHTCFSFSTFIKLFMEQVGSVLLTFYEKT